MIGLSAYIIADTFFVSKGLGTNGLTALNLAIPVYNFVHGIGLLLAIGGAAKYSIYKGQKDNKKCRCCIYKHNLYYYYTFISICYYRDTIFSKTLFVLGADETVFDMTNTYIKILLLFSPAFLCNDVLICFCKK